MAFFEYEETSMYYEIIGEGVPFLIIHGWAIDHRFTEGMFEPTFEKCSKSFQRIYIDIPGMGISRPGKVKNGDGIVAVLKAFTEHLLGDKQFYIGGNSFGSQVSRAFCAKYPEKILGMLLVVPSTGRIAKLPINGTAYEDRDFTKELTSAEIAEFKCMHATLTRETWERYIKLVRPSVEINADNEFMRKTLRGSFSFDIDSAFAKKKYTKPVFIICGKHDTAVGYEEQVEWMKLYPNGSYLCIENAGHNIHVDNPEMFTNSVIGFLNCLETLPILLVD